MSRWFEVAIIKFLVIMARWYITYGRSASPQTLESLDKLGKEALL